MKLRLTKDIYELNIYGTTKISNGTILEVEEIKDERDWEPKMQEKYWFVENNGAVVWSEYSSSFPFDKERCEMGNCFKTAESAEPYAQKMREVFKRK